MALKLQYASDLHIEFPSNREFLKHNPLKPVGDILVLTGDIVPFVFLERHQDFFTYLSDHFQITYWIPGNHEYYHFDVDKKCGMINEKIMNNVILINNTSVVYQNAHLIFSTLWSKISPVHQLKIEADINDFHFIRFKGGRFSAEQYNQLHEDCLKFIKNTLEKTRQDKVFVFTHHVPTCINYPEQYRGDPLNEVFASELSGLIKKHHINYWIYGHHHTNVAKFDVGKTHLLTNQLGYVQHNEQIHYKTDKCIELLLTGEHI